MVVVLGPFLGDEDLFSIFVFGRRETPRRPRPLWSRDTGLGYLLTSTDDDPLGESEFWVVSISFLNRRYPFTVLMTLSGCRFQVHVSRTDFGSVLVLTLFGEKGWCSVRGHCCGQLITPPFSHPSLERHCVRTFVTIFDSLPVTLFEGSWDPRCDFVTLSLGDDLLRLTSDTMSHFRSYCCCFGFKSCWGLI